MSSGYSYGQAEPTENCPYCGSVCTADWCDVGIGMVQCGPFHCQGCLASEIGPHDKERELTAREKETGWYAPGAEPGSSANVIHGNIVSHTEMHNAYYDEFANSIKWLVPGAVEKWREEIRKDRTIGMHPALGAGYSKEQQS